MFKNITFDNIVKGFLSIPRKDSIYIRGLIRKVLIKDQVMIQIELFTETQSFTSNYNLSDVSDILIKTLSNDFYQLTLQDSLYTYSYKYTKKEKLLTNKTKNQTKLEFVSVNHNKKKNYILEEGSVILPLIDLGVMTQDGKVVKSHFDKYRQINKFLEILDDTISSFDKNEINIIDFGCGKSYLTFIVYYYLTNIKHIKANIVGLDLKQDVINKCNNIALKYNYNNIKFEVGDISLYKPVFDVDLIITLHACDTATDAAIYHAIKLKASYLLSVPCCQHEINNQLKKYDNIFTSYGIIKERFSALLTDTIRGKILEGFGYSVNIMEFVDFEASPKNLLIKAKYQGKYNKDALQEVKDILNKYNINQTLYNMLEEDINNIK